MQIILNNIDNLLDINDENNFVIDVCNDFLLNNYTAINSKSLKNDSMFSIFLNVEGIDIDSYENELLIKHNANVFTTLNIQQYIKNPYYLSIKPTQSKNLNIALTYNYYQPFELFAYDDIYIDSNYQESMRLGYFKEKFPYLVLLEKNKVWMSITPHEINTMQKSIDEAFGDVLVYGLGLGYYPFMCSLKKDVNKIVIIEKDKHVIDIFKNNILPFFKFKEKIIIIQEDAFKFAKKQEKFNYAFVDLWHDASDGLIPYIKLLKEEVSSCKYFYWIEDSIISLVRKCLITLIEETFYNNYQSKINNDIDLVISKMNDLLKDLIIKKEDELYKILERDFLKKLLKDIEL